jgi:ribonuclease HI
LEAKWTRPKPRYLKLNVDASYCAVTSAGVVGAVIRDYTGNFMGAKCTHIPHVQSAQMAEAMSLRESLQMAEELGCHRVEAESDSSETIQACTGEQRWWCSAAAIYADCVDIASKIGDITFRRCPREANKAAHEMAHYSFSNNISCNWVDEPPSFLLNKLTNDVTIL